MANETNLPSQYDTDYGYDKTYDPEFIAGQQIALNEAAARVLTRTNPMQWRQEGDRSTYPSIQPDVYGYDQPTPNGARQQYHPFTINSVDVVMNQPVLTRVIRTPKPTCYTGLSVFTCLFCCMPLGLIAIIMSLKATSAAEEGSFEVARHYGESAKNLNIAGIMIGIIMVVIAGVLYHSFYNTDHYHY